MNNKIKKTIISTFALSLIITTNAIAMPNVNRIWGNNRYETAVEVSKKGWQKNSDFAIIATGENFPDALSASPLAKKLNAPILLTESDSLTSTTEEELKRLKVKKVIIVGGTAVVSKEVEAALKNMKIGTERIWGKDRYETSLKIAEKLGNTKMSIVVYGDDFPGALCMAPIAGKMSEPIILVPGDTLPDTVKKYIKNKKTEKTYMIGGSDMISESVAKEFPNVERILGADKYERNINALNKFSNLVDLKKVYIATGENFPDALSGSVLAAMNNAPILLVNPNNIVTTKNFLDSKKDIIKEMNLLGGQNIVPIAVTYPNGISEEEVEEKAILKGRGNTNGNIVNGGFVAEGEKSIYYTNIYDSQLSKSTKEGLWGTRLSLDSPSYINVLGNYVYYRNGKDQGKIYKIKTDGSKKIKLTDDDAQYINIVDGWIYYSNQSDRNRLYKMNTNGEERTRLNDDDTSCINVDNDWIYYRNENAVGRIFKVNIYGENRTQVNKDNSIYINVDNGKVFYIKPGSAEDIYVIEPNENTPRGLNVLPDRQYIVESLNVCDKFVYYNLSNTSNGEKSLYKKSIEGGEAIKLGDNIKDKINIAGDRVYYSNTKNVKILHDVGK